MGLCVDYQDQMVLDDYTTTITVIFPVFFSACKTWNLVMAEGVILRVDREASFQWMECGS